MRLWVHSSDAARGAWHARRELGVHETSAALLAGLRRQGLAEYRLRHLCLAEIGEELEYVRALVRPLAADATVALSLDGSRLRYAVTLEMPYRPGGPSPAVVAEPQVVSGQFTFGIALFRLAMDIFDTVLEIFLVFALLHVISSVSHHERRGKGPRSAQIYKNSAKAHNIDISI